MVDFSDAQTMGLIFFVGRYDVLAIAIRAFDMQLESGVTSLGSARARNLESPTHDGNDPALTAHGIPAASQNIFQKCCRQQSSVAAGSNSLHPARTPFERLDSAGSTDATSKAAQPSLRSERWGPDD